MKIQHQFANVVIYKSNVWNAFRNPSSANNHFN